MEEFESILPLPLCGDDFSVNFGVSRPGSRAGAAFDDYLDWMSEYSTMFPQQTVELSRPSSVISLSCFDQGITARACSPSGSSVEGQSCPALFSTTLMKTYHVSRCLYFTFNLHDRLALEEECRLYLYDIVVITIGPG